MEHLAIDPKCQALQLVDGNNLLMQRFTQQPGGLVVRQILEDIQACIIPPMFVFDGFKGNERRRKLYPEYKERTDKERTYKAGSYPTLEMFRTLIGFTKAVTVRLNDWEADDVLATIARAQAARGNRVEILSTDRDLSQLAVDPLIKVAFEMKYVPPSLVRLYKTFIGDRSDKISGVPNFGDKAWEFLNTALASQILETGDTFANYSASRLGLRPCLYSWVVENEAKVKTFWHITGLFDVPMQEITSNLKVGTSCWDEADRILKEYFL